MKNVSEVLTHLIGSPNFKKLHTLREASHFIQMMPLSFKNGIAFSYRKDKVLFIALKHPCFQQEFYHKIPLVKQLLKEYQQEKKALLGIQDIKSFVTYTSYQKEVEKQKENEIPLVYGELSLGVFNNLASNPVIHKKFEEIRKIILQHQEYNGK